MHTKTQWKLTQIGTGKIIKLNETAIDAAGTVICDVEPPTGSDMQGRIYFMKHDRLHNCLPITLRLAFILVEGDSK